MNFIGQPPIRRDLFFLSKFAAALSCFFLIAQTLGFDASQIDTRGLHPIAYLLLTLGLLLLGLAGKYLGRSTRIGLPTEATRLKTTGVYRFSRNPMYLGLFLVCIASCLLVPHWLNLLATVVTIALHHRIVLAEERFLGERFGEARRIYSSRVRRYL